MLAKVELPYRVIDVAAGDPRQLGRPQVRLRGLAPHPAALHMEVTSTSNCTTFQARRLAIRERTDEGNRPVATLNGTLATTRWLVAMLENHQPPGGPPGPLRRAPAIPRRARGARAGGAMTTTAGRAVVIGTMSVPHHLPSAGPDLMVALDVDGTLLSHLGEATGAGGRRRGGAHGGGGARGDRDGARRRRHHPVLDALALNEGYTVCSNGR